MVLVERFSSLGIDCVHRNYRPCREGLNAFTRSATRCSDWWNRDRYGACISSITVPVHKIDLAITSMPDAPRFAVRANVGWPETDIGLAADQRAGPASAAIWSLTAASNWLAEAAMVNRLSSKKAEKMPTTVGVPLTSTRIGEPE